MSEMKMRLIECSGTPYEIGFAHGSKAKEEVLKSIATYKVMFKDYGNLEWEEAKRRSNSYIDYINQFSPDLMEEMRGVAEGAGVELQDILALNARSEVIMVPPEAHTPVPSDGCTSLSVSGDSSKDGHILLAQNWDWKDSQLDSLIVLKINRTDKPSITMVTEAGIIGKIGCNSAGLGVCLNALGTPDKPEGVPLHVVLRGILDQEKVSDAIEKVNSLKNACAANYQIAHKNGACVDLEKAPTDFEVTYAENGLLAHTNHFITPRLYHINDASRLMVHDTFVRLGRTRFLMNKYNGNIDVDVIKTILTDHVDYPDSICSHNDPKDDIGHRCCTVFSIIMDLTEGKILVAKGQPCSSQYYEY